MGRRDETSTRARVGMGLAALVAVVAVTPVTPVAADGNEAPGNPAVFRSISGGYNHTCAVLSTGQVKCWGNNNAGRLLQGDLRNRGDNPGEMGLELPPINLGTGRTATAAVAGGYPTCAILDNATLKCWGGSNIGGPDIGDVPGETGDGLSPINLGPGRTAIGVAAGYGHTCALRDNGTVYCWGDNLSGDVGIGSPGYGASGDVDLGTGRTATALAAGYRHTCALLDNGSVKCWGLNASGQLGVGDVAVRGNGPGQMGDNLPDVKLGTGRTATAITAGGAHSCALLDNGTVKCWGAGADGRLGLGDALDRGDAPGEMGDALPAVDLGTGRTATGISAGNGHTCALLDNGATKCWGDNTTGQLGLGDTADRGDGLGEMGDNLPAVDLGTGRTTAAVTTGYEHTCAILDDTTIKCWGANNTGQLGLGDTLTRGDGPGEMGDDLPVTQVTGSGVSGTVTTAGTGAVASSVWVAALDTNDFSVAAGRIASGTGAFGISLPPGSYYLYLLDPNGARRPGFYGPPTTVTVTADQVTAANPTMTLATGSVTGTVVEDNTLTPIPNAQVVALNSATGSPELATKANASGQYTLAGLRPGNHFLAFIDPAGNHSVTFYPHNPDVLSATPVAVTAGGTTTADGSLPAQVATGTGAQVSGTIRDSLSSSSLVPNVLVIALRASDLRLARVAVSNSQGGWSMQLAAGEGYKLGFVDSSGHYLMEWYDNQPSTGLAAATTVTAPASSRRISMVRDFGTLTGQVTDAPGNAALADAWVFAINSHGATTGGVTVGNGGYQIRNLATGTYRVAVINPFTGEVEFWQDAPDYAGGTPVAITSGATTTVSPNL